MARLRWYKAEPRAFFDATRRWPFELKAAYRLVLDLVYDQDGALPDDDRWIAGELGCDVRVWRRLKARLVELGKLYVNDGAVRNPRADRDVPAALARLNQTVTAGERSAEERRKSKPKSGNFNGSGGTDVPTGVGETKSKKEKKETLAAAQSPATRAPAREETAPAGPAAAADASRLIIFKTGWDEAEAAAAWATLLRFAGGDADLAYYGLHRALSKGRDLLAYAGKVIRDELAEMARPRPAPGEYVDVGELAKEMARREGLH